MRALIAFLFVAPAGCVPAGFRVGLPPVDRNSDEVRNTLRPVVPEELKAAARTAAPPGTVPEFRDETCSGSSGEQEWYVDVRYRRADGTAVEVDRDRLPLALANLRDAVTDRVSGTSAEAVSATTRLPDDGRVFVLKYTRRGAAVGGEVVGRAEPSTTYPGFTRWSVVASE
jgi:hypothetical protein